VPCRRKDLNQILSSYGRKNQSVKWQLPHDGCHSRRRPNHTETARNSSRTHDSGGGGNSVRPCNAPLRSNRHEVYSEPGKTRSFPWIWTRNETTWARIGRTMGADLYAGLHGSIFFPPPRANPHYASEALSQGQPGAELPPPAASDPPLSTLLSLHPPAKNGPARK